MKMSEQEHFQRVLTKFAAPTLVGIKCGSMFTVSLDEYAVGQHLKMFRNRVEKEKLHIQVLCMCRNRVLLYIYNREVLRHYLSLPRSQKLLQQFGYTSDMSENAMLTMLSRRIRCCKEYPHEIGLFLGYPPQDVEGFIQNNGQNEKMCGLWKVYSNPQRAKYLFRLYDTCTQALMNRLECGEDFYSMVNAEFSVNYKYHSMAYC